jgi:hypothetical protein
MTPRLLRAVRCHARKGNSNKEIKMTTDKETKTAKQVPAFYLFDTVEQEGKKELKRIGAAFAHRKGYGFNFIINGKRYTAFPPKIKSAEYAKGGAA